MKPLELWDWQKVDQEFLARHNWTALAAAETGGGKSVLAVEAIRNSGAGRVLIVAPKQTHHTAWIPTVERQLGLTARVIGNGRKADREALADFEWGSPGIYLVTPQFLTRADVSRWEGDMIAVVVISAGGTGLDGLQRVANTEAWLERSTDPTLNLQAEARLDRIGSTKGVQRFLIQDDLGYAEGRFSKQLDRMLKLRESTRKAVK